MIPSRQQDIEITANDPFANDALGRMQYAKIFESIVSIYAEAGCVIALNGGWGTGKTTFVRMLQQDMQNLGYHPLYFNAWTNDFVSDPLIALISELKNIFPQTDKFDKIVELGGKILVDIAASAAKTLIKNKTGIDVENITSTISNDLKKGIDQYAEQKKAFVDFKQALQEYVTDNTSEPDKPVVFFIDELDRCNPHFAVQVLERVKHLFEIPNIVFVIVINKNQLCHAIHGYYGSSEIDADNYLRRFIDIEFSLPNADILKYCDMLYNTYNFSEIIENSARQTNSRLQQDAIAFPQILKYLLCSADFDLRTMDKFIAGVRLALQSYGTAAQIYPNVFLLLSFIKFSEPDLYNRIKKSELGVKDLVWELSNLMGDPIKRLQSRSYKVESLVSYIANLVSMYMTEIRQDYNSHILDDIDIPNIDKSLLLRYLEQNDKYVYTTPGLNYIIEHIEIQNGIVIYD